MGGSAGQYEPLRLQLLEGEGAGDSALFREYLDRYHYQRYRVPFGAHVRYLVRSEHWPERVLACLLWTSPAWKLAERDRWIRVPRRVWEMAYAREVDRGTTRWASAAK